LNKEAFFKTGVSVSAGCCSKKGVGHGVYHKGDNKFRAFIDVMATGDSCKAQKRGIKLQYVKLA